MKRVRKLLKRKFKEALFANKNKSFLPGVNIITLESLEPRLLLSAMWVDMDTGDEIPHATDGNDIFFGDTSDNIADGLGGDDMLYGMGGNDVLQGGPGSDVIYGSHHDDRLFGEDGNDILYGNWGKDVLDGGADDDQLFGGRQRDVLISGAGDDIMDGEKQNDTFLFTGSQNGDVKTVFGGQGNDTIDLTEFEAGSVVQNGSMVTVSLGSGGTFQINYQSVENILIVPGPVNELSIENVSLQEGDNGITLFDFTVSLSHSPLTPVMVDFATADDSALADQDYHSTSGILTFAPGIMTKTIQVPVVGDTDVEADEFFFVNLSNPNNALITDGQAAGTIINDDTLVPTLSIDDTSVVEGDNGTVNAVFTVSLSSASTETITVDFATADNSAVSGSDYQTINGALTFLPGVTTLTIEVPVIGDTDVEPDETFFLNLSNPSNAVIADNQAEGIIINDDVLVPTLSIDDASIIEGDQGALNAVFTVSLSSPSLVPITVDFSLADDTAISGLDYAALSGTLIFSPGVTTRNIQIPVIGDTDVELDETFFVNLTNAGNVIIADNQAVGIIINDDMPTVSIGDLSVVEGDDGTVDAVFSVNLSSSSLLTVTVDFATADDSAVSGSDYQAISGILTFSPGVTTQTIEVPVIGDTGVELDEMFFVNLDNPDNALITDNQAVGTIINDDVEIMPQDITVLLDTDEIADGQISPVIDFGTVIEGQFESHLTFIVRNDGDETLTLGDIVLPEDYSLSEGLVTSLQAGEFDTFTVQLDTAEVGVKPGEISFSNNDSDENPFNFTITGTVIGPEITLFAESTEVTDEQAVVN
ncbi:Calx-beta domain-containing protein, partial [Planctomycetota bacterium]